MPDTVFIRKDGLTGGDGSGHVWADNRIDQIRMTQAGVAVEPLRCQVRPHDVRYQIVNRTPIQARLNLSHNLNLSGGFSEAFGTRACRPCCTCEVWLMAQRALDSIAPDKRTPPRSGLLLARIHDHSVRLSFRDMARELRDLE